MVSSGSAPDAGANRKAIVIVVAAVVVVAVIAAAIIAVLMIGAGSNSPSGKFRDFADSLSDGDAGRSYNNTIWALNQSTYDEWVEEMGFGEADYEIEIHSLDEIPADDMSEYQLEEIQDIVDTIESTLGVVVEDYCYVDFDLTETRTVDGIPETYHSQEEMACVKVDGSWYLVIMLDDLADILHPPLPMTPTAPMSRSTITNGVKITILGITRSDVVWTDITLVLMDDVNAATWYFSTDDLNDGSPDSMNYTEKTLGSLVICCSVVDLAGNGIINAGDYFTLFTYGGAPTFATSVTYATTLIYDPTSSQMSTMTFTG